MKGYKAFGKGMICRGKQYAENTVFEEEFAEICKCGIHFCENPFDVLDYYPLVDDDGNLVEVADVESLDEAKTDDNKKFVTKKIKIGAKLNFSGFVKAGIDFLIEKTMKINDTNISSGDRAKIGSSGDYAKIGSSGDYAKIGSSGDYAQISSSGDCAKIGSSGDSAQISSSGDSAQISSSGDSAQFGSIGYCAQISSSGDRAKIGSSGDYAKIGSSGDSAQFGSSGDYAQISSSGDSAKIGSSGDYAQISSSGDRAKIGSSGDYAKIISTGAMSVVSAIGVNSKARAAKGSWITLAEYDEWNGKYYPVKCVKTEYVDGGRIKADTWYKLENGEFVEARG